MSVPGGHHLLEIGEVSFGQRLFLRQENLPGGGVAALFQRRQQHAGKVDEAHAGAAIAPFAADGGLDAADGGIVVGVLRFNPQLDELGNDDFVVVERRHPEAATDHLHAGVEEIGAHSCVVTHAEVGLGGAQAAAGFENGVGQRVDRVARPAVEQFLAADGDVLVQRAAG